MTNFASVTQSAISVSFTANVALTLYGWGVQLVDLTTGNVVGGKTYGPTVGGVYSDSLPLPSPGSQPLYLELQLLVLEAFMPGYVITDTFVLQPIGGSGGGGGGGGLTTSDPLVAVVAVAAVGLATAGLYLLSRKKHRVS